MGIKPSLKFRSQLANLRKFLCLCFGMSLASHLLELCLLSVVIFLLCLLFEDEMFEASIPGSILQKAVNV